MICQSCGSKPAIVHMNELRDGRRTHLWLCEECAANRKDWDGMDGGEPDESHPNGHDSENDHDFTSFLSQMFEAGVDPQSSPANCPACGFTLDLLGKTNRLGCPTCYETFRALLQPLLTRLHRHSSHLGKVPWRADGSLTPEGEIARHRVALERAIVAENFEEAARLRDLISRFENLTGPQIDHSGLLAPDEDPFGEDER
jgi:protein arginine kinase activator